MTVAYVHSYYYAPIRLVLYLIILVVVSITGAIARRSRRRNIGQYGTPPGQWQQQQYMPPPGSPYGAWGEQQQGYGPAAYGPQQPPSPQQGYPQQPPYGGRPQQGWDQAQQGWDQAQQGWGQAPPPQSPGQPPHQQGYQQPPW